MVIWFKFVDFFVTKGSCFVSGSKNHWDYWRSQGVTESRLNQLTMITRWQRNIYLLPYTYVTKEEQRRKDCWIHENINTVCWYFFPQLSGRKEETNDFVAVHISHRRWNTGLPPDFSTKLQNQFFMCLFLLNPFYVGLDCSECVGVIVNQIRHEHCWNVLAADGQSDIVVWKDLFAGWRNVLYITCQEEVCGRWCSGVWPWEMYVWADNKNR